jgi:MFS family permease
VIADLLGSHARNLSLPILLTSIPYVCATAFTYFIGWSSQARGERRLHTAIPFGVCGLVLLMAPLLPGGGAGAVLGFLSLCVTLSLSNGTGPLAAMVMAILPAEGRSSGIAVWNSLANLGGYVGLALFGWLKATTGSSSAGMAVRRAPTASEHLGTQPGWKAPRHPHIRHVRRSIL